MASKIFCPDIDDLVERYMSGDSVLALSERVGVSRRTINRWLMDAGIEIRTASQQMHIRQSRLSDSERRRRLERAWAAKRGRPNPVESRIRGAAARERRAEPGSDSERLLAGWLRERGMPVRHQVAIHTYNVDLAAAPIAVEVFGGNWHATGLHLARGPQRCEEIIDAGWSIVYVWDQSRCPMRVEAADHVIAFYEATRRDPSLVGEYRMVRGDGKLLTRGRGKPDYDAFIPSQCKC